MIIRNFKNLLNNISVMKFKEVLYYTLIFFYSLAILYVLVFKTELLIGRWFIGGLVVIIYLILKQLYNLINKNGK